MTDLWAQRAAGAVVGLVSSGLVAITAAMGGGVGAVTAAGLKLGGGRLDACALAGATLGALLGAVSIAAVLRGAPARSFGATVAVPLLALAAAAGTAFSPMPTLLEPAVAPLSAWFLVAVAGGGTLLAGRDAEGDA